MADWYCSSAAYAAIAAFVPSVAYTVGQIVKPTAPTALNRHAFRCTTAGTASTEPAWPATNNATITTGGATFTNVTGQSTYFWTAAGGDLGTLTGDGSAISRVVSGDRIFLSSDHSETSAGKYYFQNITSAWSGSDLQIISVNRAGSTPPAPADIASGAVISASSFLTLDPLTPVFMQGISFQPAGTLTFSYNNFKPMYLKNCALWLNTTGLVRITSGNPAKIILDNTTVQFGAAGQSIGFAGFLFDVTWINTALAVLGSVPTFLFQGNSSGVGPPLITCRGVDLSAVTTILLSFVTGGMRVLLDSCKIAAGVTRYSGTINAPSDIIELINCFDGTNIINERYVAAGSVVTERTITLTGGAADDVGPFSHKMVSTALIDKYVLPLDGFWFDVENQSVGVAHTATVEIVSSASLNNDDISLLLEYQGTSGSPVASFGVSLPATILTANAAVATSAAAWNSSPATPVYQHLQVTFTPQKAGRVRGQVRLGKASTTVYVNPVITIT